MGKLSVTRSLDALLDVGNNNKKGDKGSGSLRFALNTETVFR